MITTFGPIAAEPLAEILGFIPHSMVRIPRACDLMEDIRSAQRDVMREWAEQNFEGRFVMMGLHIYVEKENDAIMFRLAWP